MSQMIRATLSPVGPGQGNIRKVARSGRRYMSDSSIRTKPSIDEPSNMILPASASSNWRSGISTFLIVPRMSVNCRRMNFTFSRSVRSRICAFVSRMDAGVGVLAIGRDCSQLFRTVSRQNGDRGCPFMKLLRILGVLVAVAGVAALTVVVAPAVYGQRDDRPQRPFDSPALAQGRPFDSRGLPQDRRGRDLTALAGRGAG